jgi:hypothetical protein
VIDTSTPNTPGWWLKRLATKLDGNIERANLLDSYMRCENGIPITSSKAVRVAYQRLMRMARTNFAELVAEAVRERMQPVGFRTGAEADELGDAEAFRIWQANALDADSALVHRAMLSMGDAYVIVGPVDPLIEAPLITPEDPRQVVVETDPAHRRRTIAAAKFFTDDVAGLDRAYLYLPGFLVKAHRKASTDHTGFASSIGEWEWSGEPEKLDTDLVPVVRFANRCDMFGLSSGEFETAIGILDRINFTILSRIEIATLQAFRQRALKGAPSEDSEGREINYDDIFEMDPGALWLLPATAEIWESGQVDLGPIRMAVRDDVQDLAAVTRTPLFYLTADAANGSAEGASLAREGLIFKTEDRMVQTGEAWEQVMALAFTFAGDLERARRADMEVLWAPAERYSLQARYDAASKATSAGVPWRTVMTDVLQFSPQQVSRMEAERAGDLLLAASFTDQPAAATV